MNYLPDFSNEEKVFVEGLTRSNAAHSTRVQRKPPSPELRNRLLPPDQREPVVSREAVLMREDEDLVEWEVQTRAYLEALASGRKHRTSAPLIWEWATGQSIAELHAEGNRTAYAKDLRRINTILKAYFGEAKPSFINGRKFNRVYRISQHFLVKRKAPFCLSLFLEWREKKAKSKSA